MVATDGSELQFPPEPCTRCGVTGVMCNSKDLSGLCRVMARNPTAKAFSHVSERGRLYGRPTYCASSRCLGLLS